jgi:hypothetical protein
MLGQHKKTMLVVERILYADFFADKGKFPPDVFLGIQMGLNFLIYHKQKTLAVFLAEKFSFYHMRFLCLSSDILRRAFFMSLWHKLKFL